MNPALHAQLSGRRFEALAIGTSAGGVTALLKLLPALPEGFGFAVIVVMHLPDDGNSRLAEVFAQRLGMAVCEAVDKSPLRAGMVYFAPSGYHLSIEADRSFSLSREEPVHFSRPAIDILMSSAADAYGAQLAAMLLTGASADGAAGLEAVARNGGLTIVQDPADAEIATMPRAALNAFKPDLVLPLSEIHQLLTMLEPL